MTDAQIDRDLVEMQLSTCTRTMKEVALVLFDIAEKEQNSAAASRGSIKRIREQAETLMRVRAQKFIRAVSTDEQT